MKNENSAYFLTDTHPANRRVQWVQLTDCLSALERLIIGFSETVSVLDNDEHFKLKINVEFVFDLWNCFKCGHL